MAKTSGKTILLLLCAIANSTCTGSSSGVTAPDLRAGASCRNYVTASTNVTTTTTGSSSTRILSCLFNSSNQLVCTMTIDTCGTVSFTVNYASKADFVDEVSVIPPRMLQQSQTTAANGCGITNATYTYDAQKRLQSYTMNGLTVSYSAWDSSGRPTVGLVTGPGGPTSETWTYDDAARSAVLAQAVVGAASTATYTYDVNGNLASAIVVSGGSVAMSTTSIAATAQVCK
jgi:hypothetical protein